MAKLIFKLTDAFDENREASEIEFTVPDDMNINEFKVICVRLASSLGYHPNSIQKAFGDLDFGEEKDEELKQLLHELNTGRNITKS